MNASLDVPFGWNARSRTATADVEDHVDDLIRLVLFTAPGERVNRLDFGCGVKQLVFAPLSDAVAATTQHMVQGALLRWLGDLIHIEQVDSWAEDSTLNIKIVYRLTATGERREKIFDRVIPS
ncbi:MAG: GPW/gp25 family protein [Pseudomonadota bacterium]|nr:GPW/gp25 family protein [Pseudomonadota bacterium]